MTNTIKTISNVLTTNVFRVKDNIYKVQVFIDGTLFTSKEVTEYNNIININWNEDFELN